MALTLECLKAMQEACRDLRVACAVEEIETATGLRLAGRQCLGDGNEEEKRVTMEDVCENIPTDGAQMWKALVDVTGCRLSARVAATMLLPIWRQGAFMRRILDRRKETEWTPEDTERALRSAVKHAKHGGVRTMFLFFLVDHYSPRLLRPASKTRKDLEAETILKSQYTHMFLLCVTPEGSVAVMGYSLWYSLADYLDARSDVGPGFPGAVAEPPVEPGSAPPRARTAHRLMARSPYRRVLSPRCLLEEWLPDLLLLQRSRFVDAEFRDAYARLFSVRLGGPFIVNEWTDEPLPAGPPDEDGDGGSPIFYGTQTTYDASRLDHIDARFKKMMNLEEEVVAAADTGSGT